MEVCKAFLVDLLNPVGVRKRQVCLQQEILLLTRLPEVTCPDGEAEINHHFNLQLNN